MRYSLTYADLGKVGGNVICLWPRAVESPDLRPKANLANVGHERFKGLFISFIFVLT